MADYPGLPIGKLTLDAHLRIASVDDAFAQLFGGGPELVGRAFDELISDRDPGGTVALAGKLTQYRGGLIDLPLVIDTGQDRVVRVRLVQQDGRFVVYVEPGDTPDSPTYQLALSTQRWNGVMQRSDEGIALLDQAGTIVMHNTRFFELVALRTGPGVSVPESALQGRPFASLLTPAFDELRHELGRMSRGEIEEVRVRVEEDRRTLDFEGRSLRLPLHGRIESLVLVRDISEQQQIAAYDAVIAADLDQAARFQAALLARTAELPGLGLDIVYVPLQQVGGDLYDTTLLDDGTARLFIADATGHGITAALSTMLIMCDWDAVKHGHGSPAEVLAALNDRVVQTYQKLSVMFTAAIVDIAPDRRSLRYACGAHPSPIVCLDGKLTELGEGGTFLGAAAGHRYPQWTVPLDRWNWLLMLTDGVIEARDASGRLFGEETLGSVALEATERGRGINSSVMARLESHLDMQAIEDDITMLTVTPMESR